ncbi:MAG: YheT family hydrolase [Syntrophales bacterium]
MDSLLLGEPFSPSFFFRNNHIQTTFGSLHVRASGKNEMLDAAEENIVGAGDGVRLLGYHSKQKSRKPAGMIIIIHGWEGSSDSTYMLSTGRFFYRLGYEVFRLNLRDHGNSHGLNEGLFHGALTEEAASAVRTIAGRQPTLPCYLIGFSLGGNFALRIALKQALTPIANLKMAFAISPAIDPYKATLAIDEGPAVYRRYFMAKWKRSLRQKQKCFPDLYNFDSIMHHKKLMPLTEAIMAWYPQFNNYREYFNIYTLTGNVLASLAMPAFIIMAQDDPAVPVEDFYQLPANPLLHVSIQRFGGHCGFIDPFPFGCWYERQIAQLIAHVESK